MKMKTITKGSCCLLFLQCLLLGTVQGCVFNENSNETHLDGKRDCCGKSADTEFYFTKTQICCNGTVHSRNGKQCCNGELYDPEKNICCNNTVHDKENKVCCGSKLFRSDTHPVVCCGGKLHNSHQSCCGGQELYDESSQICCEYNDSFSIADNKNGDCCLDKAYDTDHQHCANGQLLSFKEDLCGINRYNTSAKICCDQTLYGMPQFLPKCCGSHLYDVSKYTCCLGTKKVIPVNLKCCGEGSFNDSSQLCCNNVIQSKENGSRCCGSETIDATKGCCGTKAYNLSTHQCCKDSTIIPEHQSCCGYSGYDNHTELCTSNYTVINRPSRSSCNNESFTKRQIVSHSICNTCLWRPRLIYKEIKAGNQYFCKRHTYNITINKTTRRDILWLLHAKYENKDKIKSNVTIIVPCKSGKLNKTGRFLLVTDSTIDGETLRLGDSDLLLQYHRKLEVLVNRKQRTCRQVSVVLSEIQKAVKRFIRKLIRPK